MFPSRWIPLFCRYKEAKSCSGDIFPCVAETGAKQPASGAIDCHCLSFSEQIEGDIEEPESRLSWLPASLRQPLVTGCSISHTDLCLSMCLFPSHFLFLKLVLAQCSCSLYSFMCSLLCCTKRLS